MSPCWASPTLFTYRVQTIPEGLLGVERKALYPQLRQHCQWNVFQLLLTLRWLQRKEWPEAGSDRWRMSLVCMAFPGCAPRVGAAPCCCSQGDAHAAGSLPAALTWSKCCIPWGPAEPWCCRQLGGPGLLVPVQTSVGPVRSHWPSGSAVGLRWVLPASHGVPAMCHSWVGAQRVPLGTVGW